MYENDALNIRQAERFEKKAQRYANKGKKAQSYQMKYLAAKYRHAVKIANEDIKEV